MSMLTSIRGGKIMPEKQQMPMPRVPTVQPVQPRPIAPQVTDFLQRVHDDQAEIERLKADCDSWRSRALAGDEQIKRLEMQLDREMQESDRKLATVTDHHDREYSKLAGRHDEDVERLTDERDFYKLKYARTYERLQIVGKTILDVLKDDEPAAPKSKVDLEKIAQELALEPPRKASDEKEETSNIAS